MPPSKAEAEFDSATPAENEFDAAGAAPSEEQQILAAATNPVFRIGHRQEMPVTVIEGGPQPDAVAEAAGRGIDAPLRSPNLGVDPGDLAAVTQHMQNISTVPGVAKNVAAATAANFAGAPVGIAGAAGLGGIQAGTAAAADNPGATPEDIGKATGLGALVGGGAHLLGAAGSKLINAANKGLARIALSPAEAARLRAIGGEDKLADLGQRMRDAGLDKGRTLLQKLTPTDAKRIADNAQELTAVKGPEIKQLEDQLMQHNNFGQTEVDTSPLTSELRGYTRPNSAETSTPKIARAMEKQAARFESVPQDVTVQREAPIPPPPLMKGPTGAPPPLPSELVAPPAPPVPPPSVQTELPLPEPQYQHHMTPASNGPAIGELGLRPEQGGKNFDFAKNKNSIYMSRPEDAPMWADKVQGLTGEPPLELRTTAPAVTPPGANPAVRVRSEAIAPERIQVKNAEGGWGPVSDLAPPAPEPPAPPSPQLNFGVRPPTEAPAQVTEPYNVQRAALDKRDIAQQLFDTKQRALKPNYGEDKAREMSWRWLKDRLQQEIDKGAASGVLDPSKVAEYRKAAADFHTAADVQVDTAKRAESELRRSDRLFYGGAQATSDAMPGTAYNLGRLLKKAPGVAPTAINALPSTGTMGAERAQSRGLDSPAMSFENRQKAEKQANEDMKTNLFKSWYNHLVGN